MSNIFHDFSKAPASVDIQRSRFAREHTLSTSWNLGTLFPIYFDEVVPGDTFDLNASFVANMTSLKRPIFDPINFDTFFFFVPYRLLWDHWINFMGENTSSSWVEEETYTVPTVTVPEGGYHKGTLGNYFGLPDNKGGMLVSSLPFKAFTLIYNEWFRNQATEDPYLLDTGDSSYVGSNAGTLSSLQLGGICPTANKYKDYFTSCLPAPQKGDPVTISLGTGVAPVDAFSNNYHRTTNVMAFGTDNASIEPGKVYGLSSTSSTMSDSVYALAPSGTYSSISGLLNFNNLGVNLSDVTVATVNQLRTAFQLQKILERDAVGGTRYCEVIKSHFNVTCPDYRVQRPEYLGGKRVPINMQQVAQTSATNSSSAQANLAAYSHTSDSSHIFTKSFTEFGCVVGVAVARQQHTYNSCVDKFWRRKNRFDFYFPELANISEQPVYQSEVFAVEGDTNRDTVLGYQEAWADYRFKRSMVTGMLSPNLGSEGLENWSATDTYSNGPTLTGGFLKETPDFLDRCLAYDHTVADQFVGNFYFKNICSRPMPVYSRPGLIDHH